MAKVGYNVHAVVQNEYHCRAYSWHGINVHPCNFRYLEGSNFYYVPDTITLIGKLRQINADFYLMKNPISILFGLAFFRQIHGSPLIKWIASDIDCNKASINLVSILGRVCLRFVDYAIFQTHQQFAMGEKELGLKGSVVRNISHGPSPTVHIAKDFDVLWVGSCSEVKQPELVLELARALPSCSFRYVLSATENNELYEQKILPGIKAIENIESLGEIQYSEIDRVYSRAKLLICTSAYEGFPNTFLQAWQHGVPVVSLSDRLLALQSGPNHGNLIAFVLFRATGTITPDLHGQFFFGDGSETQLLKESRLQC